MSERASERIRDALHFVEQACSLLARPSVEALDRCTGVLETACSILADCAAREVVAARRVEVLPEVRRLQERVQDASRLLQTARQYHTQWSQAWAVVSSGYAPGGAPTPVRRSLMSLTG
ncbi:MAG TPA: hypothetical protein VKU19_26305 [Bryobacteraceae bacterium]|nr:hypothetical protein [Bryobacteraceae bacterium]